LWPTVYDLANAHRADVLREWSWLGFNRRAINLHEACKLIAASTIPVSDAMSDYVYLRSLPWVWEYTANAVLAFAYNQEVPVMDINIKRVLIHTFQLSHDTPLFELQELALSLVPQWRSRDWHNALMDYGSQVLHSRATWIQSAKQSTFKWSDREVRGWIIKQITSWIKLTKQDVIDRWPEKNCEAILQKLQSDGLVSVQWWRIGILQ
jgi:A/G-specific adenine glycosylase